MKAVLIVLSIVLSINYGQTREVMHIVTEDPYQWFPLRSNRIRFDVMANSDVFIRLSAIPTRDNPFYKFIIGTYGNTMAVLLRDSEQEFLVEQAGKFLSGNKYDAFIVTMDERDSSVSLKNVLDETIIYYKDPNFRRMDYFGFSTTSKVRGDFLFDVDDIFPSNVSKTKK